MGAACRFADLLRRLAHDFDELGQCQPEDLVVLECLAGRPLGVPERLPPASRRWASRTTSSGGGIQHARTSGHGIPDVAAQVAGRAEIDFPAEQLGQLEFKTGQQEQTRDPPGLELDEEVDVTIWAQLATKRRAEEAQPANAVSLTERLEHRIVDGDTGCQLHPASVAVKARDRTNDEAKGPPAG